MEEAIRIVEELQKNENGELLNCWDYGEEAQAALKKLLDGYKEKEADLYAANQLVSELLDITRDSVPKEDIREMIDELKLMRDMNQITGVDIAIWKLNETLEVDYYGK